MNIREAKIAGVNAFMEGRKPAPALNQRFLIDACASPVETVRLLAAYSEGWTVASLAAAAVEAGIHDMPSISALKKITASDIKETIK